MFLAPGEITPVDHEVIPPESIAVLRSEVEAMMQRDDFRGAHIFYTDAVRLSEGAFAVIDLVHNRYAEWLANCALATECMESSIVPGKFTNLPWHTDTPGDIRFLLNIGPETKADIAEVWDPAEFSSGTPRSDASPVKIKSIALQPGGLYMANNLTTDPRIMRPHQTPPQPNRLVLRTSCYVDSVWQLASSPGPTVEIALPTDLECSTTL